MPKTLTREEVFAMLDPEIKDHAVSLITRWLDRGDGCAVYENEDLSSPNVGHKQFCSFGSPAAQIPDDPPPQRMPDIGRINWAYQLIGTCKESR